MYRQDIMSTLILATYAALFFLMRSYVTTLLLIIFVFALFFSSNVQCIYFVFKKIGLTYL